MPANASRWRSRCGNLDLIQTPAMTPTRAPARKGKSRLRMGCMAAGEMGPRLPRLALDRDSPSSVRARTGFKVRTGPVPWRCPFIHRKKSLSASLRLCGRKIGAGLVFPQRRGERRGSWENPPDMAPRSQGAERDTPSSGRPSTGFEVLTEPVPWRCPLIHRRKSHSASPRLCGRKSVRDSFSRRGEENAEGVGRDPGTWRRGHRMPTEVGAQKSRRCPLGTLGCEPQSQPQTGVDRGLAHKVTGGGSPPRLRASAWTSLRSQPFLRGVAEEPRLHRNCPS